MGCSKTKLVVVNGSYMDHRRVFDGVHFSGWRSSFGPSSKPTVQYLQTAEAFVFNLNLTHSQRPLMPL